MTAQDFWGNFQKIFKNDSPLINEAKTKWQSNKKYTEFILCKIGNFLKEDNTVFISKEYYRIDLTSWRQLKGNQYKLFENKDFEDKEFENYLWDLEVAVEHENNDKSWMDEVVKLLHINCPLRVVIGYLPFDKNDKQQYYLDEITKQIKVTKAVDNLCSLKIGEFMIIIGDSKCGDDKTKFCHYQAYVFNKKHEKFERLN